VTPKILTPREPTPRVETPPPKMPKYVSPEVVKDLDNIKSKTEAQLEVQALAEKAKRDRAEKEALYAKMKEME
jgi:hypothetical protein